MLCLGAVNAGRKTMVEPKIVTEAGRRVRVHPCCDSWGRLRKVMVSSGMLSVTNFDVANATALRDVLTAAIEQGER